MKKVVVVMTYFERPHQLRQTLKSIAKTAHTNYEVVIVDDCSRVGMEAAVGLLEKSRITILHTTQKQWTNPEPAYNIGIYYAMLQKPDVVVLQNAECYHVGDVISDAAARTSEANYITYGCFSLDEANTFRTHDITALLQANEIGASRDGQCAWYNHPQYRPVALEFCAAISAKNMAALNGYDERLADGIGYGDDYLRERIKMLGLQIEITAPPAPFVVHQWHERSQEHPNKAALVARNHTLCAQLVRERVVRAVHKYTPDLCVYC
jgi:glycosyltransferase involved in cell wall biosynthesis